MNKDLIKKHKKEFDHWLDGGKLAFKHKDLKKHSWGWITDAQATFAGVYEDKYLIVISDEYVEYRKALAEGKTVEYRNHNSKPFKTFNGSEFHCTSEYRIKPDEPEFKVGNYAVCKGCKPILITSQEMADNENFHLDTEGARKLWTLEEADGDEWVYVQWDCSTRLEVYQVEELRNEMLDEHCISKVVRTIPMIGQTPEQLGLEK